MQLTCTVTQTNEENIYIYYDEETRDAVVIDPGFYDMDFLTKLADLEVNVRAILLTHGHYDHMFGAMDLKKLENCEIYAGEKEELVTNDPSVSFTDRVDSRKFVAKYSVKDGQILEFGSIRLRVIATPGHTPGGVCYLDESTGAIFTGDTLFKGTHGRTDFPYGDAEALKNSLNKLFELPDHYKAFPGHYGTTTIGYEKLNNNMFKEDTSKLIL